jgi:hypothetical protein
MSYVESNVRALSIFVGSVAGGGGGGGGGGKGVDGGPSLARMPSSVRTLQRIAQRLQDSVIALRRRRGPSGGLASGGGAPGRSSSWPPTVEWDVLRQQQAMGQRQQQQAQQQAQQDAQAEAEAGRAQREQAAAERRQRLPAVEVNAGGSRAPTTRQRLAQAQASLQTVVQERNEMQVRSKIGYRRAFAVNWAAATAVCWRGQSGAETRSLAESDGSGCRCTGGTGGAGAAAGGQRAAAAREGPAGG